MLRRNRLAAAASIAFLALAAQAQTGRVGHALTAQWAQAEPRSTAPAADAKPTPDAPVRSAMTAQLFYEVLMGELATRSGDPGAGYSLTLDAARRSGDGKLFQRAAEIAMQSRSGEAALVAVRAWKAALPGAREARRLELQILIALNRLSETVEPLRAELEATPVVEHPLFLTIVARSYARAPDKKLAASVVERALVDDLARPSTAGLAWATVGRLRLLSGDTSGALAAALKGQEADATADGPVLLALDLIDPGQPLAEPIVTRYLQGAKPLPEIRMGYARALTIDRRYAEAIGQLQTLSTAQPTMAEPWLLLGSLQAQMRDGAAAEKALQRYVELATADDAKEDAKRGLTQAYLQLSQLAERRKDLKGAEEWLARIDNSDDLLAAQTRRAGLLARQGQLPQARELIRALPERNAEDRSQKLMAEVQVLRDAKAYQAAYDLLAQAAAAAPDDVDLVYDQAMMAEKLNRLDEMERLLRRLIALKPNNQNAYNALGYSLADRKERLDEARTLIQKAVELAPEDPFIADSLGWVEFRLGNLAEATRILEAAYKRRPDAEIGAHLGEVLWVSGEKDRALAIWKEASLADAENETLQETLKRLRVNL